jgi:hypothetical protein
VEECEVALQVEDEDRRRIVWLSPAAHKLDEKRHERPRGLS